MSNDTGPKVIILGFGLILATMNLGRELKTSTNILPAYVGLNNGYY